MIVAGTGHRPIYMPCKYDQLHSWHVDLKTRLTEYLAEQQPSLIISGMALGFDTLLASIAIELDIPFHAYVPFKGQGLNWRKDSKRIYFEYLEKAEKVIYTSENYSEEAFFIRDKAMVNVADIIVALLNPVVNKGGTFYTVNYAKSLNKDIINFWKDDN